MWYLVNGNHYHVVSHGHQENNIYSFKEAKTNIFPRESHINGKVVEVKIKKKELLRVSASHEKSILFSELSKELTTAHWL